MATAAPRIESTSAAFNTGQQVGDLISIVAGAAEAAAGLIIAGGGTVGGIVTSPTGVGAIAGAAVATGGLALTAHGSNSALNGLKNLNSNGKQKEKTTSDGRERQKSDTKLEKDLNQQDGLTKKQDAAKKNAPPGQKQTQITETKKSDQNVKTSLRRIKTKDDLNE